MYKILATDMDGTLLNSKKEVTKETFDAIQEAKKYGKKIVLATGRPLPGVVPYLNELNLNEEGDYVICFNGALVQEVKTKKIISNIEISYDDFKLIYEFAKKHNTNIHINTPTNLIIPDENPSKYTLVEANLNKIDVVHLDENSIDENIHFCKIMITDEAEVLEDIIKKIPKEMFEKYTIVRSAPFFLEFLNKDANKGNALKTLCNYLNIDIKDAIAVGDEENDQHMIKYAGLGVAMANARDSIKEIANYITSTNNENGVCKVIKEFLLK